jgi:uncharacterized protein
MTDGTYSKPLPRLSDPESAPFWAGLREHRLRMPGCSSCGYVRWPGADLCPECLSSEFAWADLRPAGELWSYVVYHRAFHPGFQDDLPYAVGHVVLDDGPVLTAQIASPLDAISIGARVEATFEDVTTEVTLLRWVVTHDA